MIKFGTDGWRALIADEFTFRNVETVAQAFSEFIGKTGKPVIVGYDNRFLSEQFAEAAAKVVASNGIKVFLSKASCPSPAVSFHVKDKGAAAGIMITASHNPPQWNGFKVKGDYGGSATPEITGAIENLIDGAVPRHGGKVELFDPKDGYIETISRFVDLSLISRSGIKVLIDPMYGSGIGYLEGMLKGKAQIEEVNNRRDPLFGGLNPEPIPANLIEFCSLCGSRKTTGIVMDGDADRIAAVGSDGVFINTHQVFALLLYHLVKNRKWTGGVVKTFNLTELIDLMCAKYGLELTVTPIGFKHIADLMLKKDILLGGEESGGMGIKGHIPERDAPLAALMLAELMAYEKKPLDAILADISKEFKRFYYDRKDLHLTEGQKSAILKLLDDSAPPSLAGSKVSKVERLDGTKLFLEDGSWVLFRASGTEPLLRIYCESVSQKRVAEILEDAQGLIVK